MKTKSLLIGALFGSSLILGLHLLYAQETTTTIQSGATTAGNLDWSAVSDMQVVLSAIEQTTPISQDALPQVGTFWSAQHSQASSEPWPPFPSSFGHPAWALPDGNTNNNIFLLDDINFNYSAPQTASLATKGGMQAMDDSGPIPAGLTNSGSGGSPNGPITGAGGTPIDTNSLWLQITNDVAGIAYLALNNATDQVYAIWSGTNLSTNFPTGWQVETEVFPTDTNCMPFTVQNLNRPNLFLYAEDWTGVTENGNLTPCWWFWEFFGTINLSDTTLDSLGNTLHYDYTHGLDPNIIFFSLQFQNYENNANPVYGNINVQGGEPFYEAVLVNDTNQADAVWQPYTSTNLAVNLNSGNGLYTIYVGLRGSQTNEQQTWIEEQVLLEASTPTFIITNPAGSTVSQPIIQLQGFVNETLSNLTFSVSNALGVVGNQPGYWQPVFYDTNLTEFTTNAFQCYDIPLTNGLNVITLQATDLAGNTATTNVDITLDYSTATPPALGILWPPDGTYISGSNFVLQAQVNDDTATVSAQITDAYGDTNAVQGLVERSGLVWGQNLPLSAGANILTVTASNAAGYVTTTNLTLNQSAVVVTMQPLSQYNQSSLSVYGTISDTNYDIWVNGVQAYYPGGQNWEADNVPVNPVGTATFDVEIYTGDPVNVGSQIISQPQPPVVAMMSYNYHSHLSQTTYNYCPNGPAPITTDETINWLYQNGGAGLTSDSGIGGDCKFVNGSGDTSLAGGYNGYTPTWECNNYNESLNESGDPPSYGIGSQQTDTKTRVMIVPSDQATPGQTALYLVSAQVFDEDTGDQIPGSEIQFANQVPGTQVIDVTAGDGSVWSQGQVSGPVGESIEMTPTVPVQNYEFNDMQVVDLTHIIAVDNNRDGQINFDDTDATTPSNPYRFWLNNNYDGYDSSIDDYDDLDPSTGDDANNTSISCTRDLEDYTRLWINTQGFTTELQNGTILLALQWKNTTGLPAIRLFPAVEATGGTLYLTDESTALQQSNAPYGNCIKDSSVGEQEVDGTMPFFIPTDFWANLSDDQPVAHLLFDAVGHGSGQLVVSIYKNDGVTKIADCPQPLYLKLQDITEMYERYTVGEDPNTTPTTTASLVTTPYSYDSTIPAGNDYILFVHGWNLPTWEKDAFAQTAFKRLYWQGYKGHFGEFRWPTGYGFDWTGIITDPRNYDNSESNAWASATGLKNLLTTLDSEYPGNVYLMAHSMGNVVAGEALRLADSSQVVNTYVAMQGAVPAHCYDPTTANRAAVNLPDFYANYYTSGAPCYFNGITGAGAFINFYNANDWALGWWGTDQNLKPDSGHLYSAGQFYRGTLFTTPIYFPADTYEIFAYCDPAPCFALGAQANMGGAFSSGQLDLDATYNFGSLHKGHSAEFNSDNMNRAPFWSRTLIKFGLKEE